MARSWRAPIDKIWALVGARADADGLTAATGSTAAAQHTVTATAPRRSGTDAASLLRTLQAQNGEARADDVVMGQENEDAADEAASRHYFVFSTAGKLVYATGAEAWAVSQTGVMHALVSLFAGEHDAGLQEITLEAGGAPLRIAFLGEPPLYVACASSHKEPRSHLEAQLRRVHAAIVSLASAARLERLFERMPNFDLRGLIGPMHTYVDGVVADMHASPALAFGALPICPLPAAVRDGVAQACLEVPVEKRPKHLLYALVLSEEALLVSLVHPRRHTPSPTDLALLTAMVRHGAQGPDDLWAPFCLPDFAPRSFVYVYATWLRQRASLVLVCGDQHGYAVARALRAELAASPSFAALGEALAMSPPLSADALQIPGLGGFAFASRHLRQCLCTRDASPTLLALYAQLLASLRGDAERPAVGAYAAAARIAAPDALHRMPPVAVPLQLHLLRTSNKVLLGWCTASFELCMTVRPWLAKSAVADVANRVVAWIRERDASLFLAAKTW